MVWCNSCKEVVWAYDHQPEVDLRGICNMLKLPCPNCGVEGNFDGWGSDDAYNQVKDHENQSEVYDDWSAMKFIAKHHGVKWNPSPDNRWFPKPKLDPYADPYGKEWMKMHGGRIPKGDLLP